jgi:hypothetical protein
MKLQLDITTNTHEETIAAIDHLRDQLRYNITQSDIYANGRNVGTFQLLEPALDESVGE